MKLHNSVNEMEWTRSIHAINSWDCAGHEPKLDLWLEEVNSSAEDVCDPFPDRGDDVVCTASINADEISRVRRMLTNNLRLDGTLRPRFTFELDGDHISRGKVDERAYWEAA